MTYIDLIQHQKALTKALSHGPLNPETVLERAEVYRTLGYPDLAVADAYYALTLVETVLDPEFSDLRPECDEDGHRRAWPCTEETTPKTLVQALKILVESLIKLGCLQQAWTHLLQLRNHVSPNKEQALQQDLQDFSHNILERYRQLRPHVPRFETLNELEERRKELPPAGFAPREVYPWNSFEPDRTSSESLRAINDKLESLGPDLEVRATILPILAGGVEEHGSANCIQLGLFAKRDLSPCQNILRERSIITAIRPIDASRCDLCAAPLPELSASNPPVACPECVTTIFCSSTCLAYALLMYHKPPFCGNEDGLDDIGREADSLYPADDLYFLLVARTIAMAEAQDIHPLDLFETKFLCGEFAAHNARPSLPFSFTHNVILPFRFFTTLMLSDDSITPYSAKWMQRYDHWIIQTLYAKFRGVASARQSTWDAKPEVAAVHPLWCLANHSCAPNVSWTWGESPEIVYTVREKSVWQKEDVRSCNRGGRSRAEQYTRIKKDEEIMNHYVDVELPVQERREYAMGPLGGMCRCERCLVESGEKG